MHALTYSYSPSQPLYISLVLKSSLIFNPLQVGILHLLPFSALRLLTPHPLQWRRLVQLLGLLKLIAVYQTDLVLLLLLQRTLKARQLKFHFNDLSPFLLTHSVITAIGAI